MTDSIPSANFLRKSLSALGLPVYGIREKMFERLQNPEKKKPGPKPGSTHKKDPTTPLAPNKTSPKSKVAKVVAQDQCPQPVEVAVDCWILPMKCSPCREIAACVSGPEEERRFR
eukprot:2026256-Prymnesium_polylepis.2